MTGTKPTTRIAELPVRWLRDHMHEALIIYGLAMGYDSAVVAGRYGYAAHEAPRRRRGEACSAHRGAGGGRDVCSARDQRWRRSRVLSTALTRNSES